MQGQPFWEAFDKSGVPTPHPLLVDLDYNRLGTALTKHQQPRYN